MTGPNRKERRRRAAEARRRLAREKREMWGIFRADWDRMFLTTPFGVKVVAC